MRIFVRDSYLLLCLLLVGCVSTPTAAPTPVISRDACGAGYPEGFPCIGGGTIGEGVEGLPNVKSMSIVNYAAAPKAISQQLETKARKAGWQLVRRDVDREVAIGPAESDDQRYRTTFEREGQIVRVSAYRLLGQTVLMVVVLNAEP